MLRSKTGAEARLFFLPLVWRTIHPDFYAAKSARTGWRYAVHPFPDTDIWVLLRYLPPCEGICNTLLNGDHAASLLELKSEEQP